uniref:Uncharacterized protein n=1 Tax=Romanomermis culicivorax TaxID=13658 RepID=A0A915L0N3_ROMCU
MNNRNPKVRYYLSLHGRIVETCIQLRKSKLEKLIESFGGKIKGWNLAKAIASAFDNFDRSFEMRQSYDGHSFNQPLSSNLSPKNPVQSKINFVALKSYFKSSSSSKNVLGKNA